MKIQAQLACIIIHIHTCNIRLHTHNAEKTRQTFLTLTENFLSQLEQELTSLSLSHFLSLALDCITYTSNTHTHTHTHMFPHPHTHVFPHTHTRFHTHTHTHTQSIRQTHQVFSILQKCCVVCVNHLASRGHIYVSVVSISQ